MQWILSNFKFGMLLGAPSVTSLSILFLFGGPARALTFTNYEDFSPVLQVDNGSLSTGLLIGGLGSSVTNVSLSISLTKCGGFVPIGASGKCNSTDFSYNSEIQFFLESPERTFAQIVRQGDLSGQASGTTVTWNFQDSFSSPVSGFSLVSGNYQSSELFSIFNGENPNGTWRLTYEDTGPGAPLSLNSWSLSVTDNSPPGPGPGPGPADVPGPLPLAGLAAAFGWSRLLRKRIRAHRDPRPGS